MITVAYMTNRLDPKIEWFFDSFHLQTGGDYKGIRVVVVDFHREHITRNGFVWDGFKHRIEEGGGEIFHIPPKPTVWQGPYRLTKEDYFAAANARNTAVCMAPDGHIAYVDDLSVLLPTWWSAVKEGTSRKRTITLGAYAKVLELKVENGKVVSFKDHEAGKDVRMRGLVGEPPYPCNGQWHWGSSLIAPVEAYLEINGWPEACDGLSYEDAITGEVLQKIGWHFKYDTRMMTYESEEMHAFGKPFKRWDKGVSPNDKSHAMLAMYRNVKRFPNYFDPPGISALREKVLNGGSFPVCQIPQNDWYDGQLLSEM